MFKSKYTGEEIEAILDEAKTPYTLPIASSNTLGGIKTNYVQVGQNYPVKTDGEGRAYVNVPWSDTNTTYGVVSTSANGLMPKLPTTDIVISNDTYIPSMQVLTGDGKYKALKLGYNSIINRIVLGFYDNTYGFGDAFATIPVASTTTDGLMSKSDKQKLDGIKQATTYTHTNLVIQIDLSGIFTPVLIRAEDDSTISSCMAILDSKGWNVNILPFANNDSSLTFETQGTKVIIRGVTVATMFYL